MIKTTNFTYGEIVEDFNQSHLEKIKIKSSKITASEHLPLLCFSSRTKTILLILSFQSDPCLLYMVTFSDLKGRKEYKLCVKTQRRCARHKQVKTLQRHLKSYITLCNITSCNIMEKWKNRPATVCALHNLMQYNLMQYYLMQYYRKMEKCTRDKQKKQCIRAIWWFTIFFSFVTGEKFA